MGSPKKHKFKVRKQNNLRLQTFDYKNLGHRKHGENICESNDCSHWRSHGFFLSFAYLSLHLLEKYNIDKSEYRNTQ